MSLYIYGLVELIILCISNDMSELETLQNYSQLQ
jgi:hypothetical protein